MRTNSKFKLNWIWIEFQIIQKIQKISPFYIRKCQVQESSLTKGLAALSHPPHKHQLFQLFLQLLVDQQCRFLSFRLLRISGFYVWLFHFRMPQELRSNPQVGKLYIQWEQERSLECHYSHTTRRLLTRPGKNHLLTKSAQKKARRRKKGTEEQELSFIISQWLILCIDRHSFTMMSIQTVTCTFAMEQVVPRLW